MICGSYGIYFPMWYCYVIVRDPMRSKLVPKVRDFWTHTMCQLSSCFFKCVDVRVELIMSIANAFFFFGGGGCPTMVWFLRWKDDLARIKNMKMGGSFQEMDLSDCSIWFDLVKSKMSWSWKSQNGDVRMISIYDIVHTNMGYDMFYTAQLYED